MVPKSGPIYFGKYVVNAPSKIYPILVVLIKRVFPKNMKKLVK